MRGASGLALKRTKNKQPPGSPRLNSASPRYEKQVDDSSGSAAEQPAQDDFYPLDVNSDSGQAIRWNITFLCLANRLGKVYIYRFNKAPSLWIFGPQNALRKIIIYLITNQLFELFIILTILVNCVLLALEGTPEEVEYVFTAIYTSEMILKILAKGFILHKFAYLRDPWNWLDFIVVILGYLTIAPNVENLSGFRTFRVLRALRTISAIEGLKTMVNALLKSMRMLGDVLILTSFFICVFALVGLQLFSGVLHNRCVYDHYVPSNISNITSNVTDFVMPKRFVDPNSNVTVNKTYEPVLEYICGNNTGSRLCPTNYTCTPDYGPNPNYGFTSFDNIGWAVLTSFQLITLDYWENVYQLMMEAAGPWYIFYFMLVIFFGSFYLINLVLAVVAVSYQEETCVKSNMLAELGAPIYRISIFQESQYNRLRKVCTSYSLHRRIMPKMVYDDPVVGSIAELSCVKNCNNVIVLSRNNSARKYENTKHEFNNPNVIGGNNNDDDSDKRTPEKERNDLEMNRTHLTVKFDTPSAPSTPIVEKKSVAFTSNGLPNGLVANGVGNSNSLQIPSSEMVVLPPADIDDRPVEVQPDKEDAEAKGAMSGVMDRLGGDDNDKMPPPYAGYAKYELKCRHRFRQHVHAVTVSPWFEIAITLCIIVNTVILASEHHGMDEKIREGMNLANHVFTAVFILEMILKLTAFGPRGYVKSKWNIFDGTVVCISIIDTVVEIVNQGENGDLTILRSFRLFRVFKLAQSWSTMRMLLSAIARSLGALGNLCLILGIIIYMLAVVGVNLFGDKYDPNKFPDKRIPVWNFSNFGHSVLMLFRVLCGEWIEPLYDAMQTTGSWAIVFFLPALIVGNFLVLNLFLALLLNSFSEQALEEELKKRKFINAKLKWTASSKKMLSKFGTKKDSETEKDVSLGCNSPNLERLSARLVKQDMVQEAAISSLSCVLANSAVVEQPKGDEESPPAADPTELEVVPRNSPGDGKSSVGRCIGRIREKTRYIIQHPYFDNLILVLICVSSLILVFEDIHLSSKPTLEYVLKILNLIFCVLFFIEMVLKLIGLGIAGYFKNPWNILDFIIVVVSVAGVVGSFSEGSNSNVQSLKSLRTLRALRPLRAVSRWEGMKIVVNSLLKAIPSIANVLVVCMFFWLIFSILGVQFFGGKFYKCIDADGGRILASLVPNKTECFAQGYRWRNSMVNFDNTFNGFLALFQVATFEGWMEVMRDGVDSVDYDMQPIRDNKFGAYFFFVVFIIVGSFFILNLFISVIIDNFYRLKKQYEDGGAVEVFLTETQKQWFLTVKKALSKKPSRILKRPKSAFRSKLFDFVISRRFETFIMMMILTNIVCMMVHHYKESETVTMALRYLNIAFCIIFTVEGVMRIIALGVQYFKSAWNVFDFIVVLLSYVGLVMDFMDISLSFSPSLLRVARVLRIGRLLRYFTAAKGIRRLLVALIISLPALVNIGALLFLILFIYSIIGMSNFGYVIKHGAITSVVNFETFGSSMLVLFRLTTSAGWNEVLDALMVQPPYCDPKWGGHPNGNCGIPWQAILFLVTYILITFLIIVNMYIAIILENFNQAHQQEESGVTDEDIEGFYTVWQQYDPLASQYINYDRLSDFVANLDPPLGIPVPNKIAVHNLNLPLVEDDHIHCTDLLQALVTRFMGAIEGSAEHYNEAVECVTRKTEETFPVKRQRRATVTTMEKLGQVNAAILMQRTYRRWKRARERRLALMGSHMSVRDVEEGGAGPSKSRASSSGSRRVASATSSRGSKMGSKRNTPVMDAVKSNIALEDLPSSYISAVEQVDSNTVEISGIQASKPRAHRTSINVISPATLENVASESRASVNRRQSLTESSTKDWQSSFESTSTPEPELTRPFSSSRGIRTSDYDSSTSPRSNIIEEESPSGDDNHVGSKATERRRSRIRSGSDNPNFQSSLDDYNSTTSSGISSKSIDILPDINM